MIKTFISLDRLTVKLGLPGSYLKKMAEQKKIPSLNVNGRLRFNLEQVKDALACLSRDKLVGYQELAEQSAIAGLFAYDAGEVPQDLIDQARVANIKTAEQAMQLCRAQIGGKELTTPEIEHIIRSTFFLFGVDRAIRFNRIRGVGHDN